MSVISDFKAYLDSLLDKKNSVLSKFVSLFFLLLMIILIEFIFDFSFNNHVNNKLNQLQKVNLLKKEYSKDSLYLNKLLVLEKTLINKTHYHSFVFRFLNSIDIKSIISDSNNNAVTDINMANKNMASPFWVYITSNLMLLLFTLSAILIAPVRIRDLTVLEYFKNCLIISVFSFIISLIIFIIFIRIPVLFNYPIINYILYSIINITLFTLIVTEIIKKKKLQNEKAYKEFINKES